MITVKTFIFNPYQVNTYLLYDETNECVMIDPGCYFHKEADQIFSFVTQKNLRPVKILITHGHFDHILGVSAMKQEYRVPVLMNESDMVIFNHASEHARNYGLNFSQPESPDVSIKNGEEILFGNSHLKTIHCPGHSPGSIVFHSPEQKIIFAGDVLFNGSIGRTDLECGNMETLLSSIKDKLLILDGSTKVYCGHGPETTIANESYSNPFL